MKKFILNASKNEFYEFGVGCKLFILQDAWAIILNIPNTNISDPLIILEIYNNEERCKEVFKDLINYIADPTPTIKYFEMPI